MVSSWVNLGLVTRNGFIDAAANGQVPFRQAFQRGVNVVLRIINNAVIRQITFHFGGNFGGDPRFTISPTSSLTRCACYLSQYFGQLIIINLQFAGSPIPVMPLPPLF